MYLVKEFVSRKSSMKNIVLIGLMGAGKSTIGKRLSKKLHCNFVDTDLVIEEKCGTSVSIVFEVEGESGFRIREHKVLVEYMNKANIVIATGGGAPIEKNNRTLLKNGLIFYLFSEPSSIWKRLAHDDSRPILQNSDNIKKTIFELFSKRDPIYRELADHVIICENLPLKSIVAKIMNILKLEGFLRQSMT